MTPDTSNLSDQIGEILEVLGCLVEGRPPTLTQLQSKRVACVKQAADRRGIDTRTVADECWHQLGLEGINKFDDLVWMWLHGRDPRLRTALEENTPRTNEANDLAAISEFFAIRDVPAVWWVNQGETYSVAKEFECLWAPQYARDGKALAHHVSNGRLKHGDVVIHYANGSIRAVGEVQSNSQFLKRPYLEESHPEFDRIGYLTKVKYHELKKEVPIDDIDLQRRSVERGPFTRDGVVTQSYLTELTMPFWSYLVESIGALLPAPIRLKLKWEQMLSYMESVRANTEFDREERDYKLEIAERVQALVGARSADREWSAKFERVFESPNNLLDWRVVGPLKTWIEEPDRSDRFLTAMNRAKEETNDIGPRFELIADAIEGADLSSGAVMAATGFFLFGLDPSGTPMVRLRPFEILERFVEEETEGSAPPLPRFKRHVMFAYDVQNKLKDRGVSIRDMVDTQSLIYASGQDTSWMESEMVTNRPQSEGPSLEDLSEETHVPIEELTDLLDILEEKQQVIFEGPPGSGKTYIAEKLARYVSENQLSGEHDSRFNIVQFHQSYGYEDFVQGIRPITGSDGNLSYELRDGIFKRFCDRATDDPDGKHVIVIDEINRGDVSRILGELLLLFEYRDKSIDLAYSGPNDLRFSIPPNVYILGTMNTADRSLTQIDYALRRRFYFYRLIPVVNGEAAVLARWLDSELFDAEAKGQILDLFIKLNQRIDELLGENYQVGHSFFMVKGIDQFAVQERVFQRAILPLLEEYFHNHRNRREVVSGFQRQELLSSGTTSDDE